MLLWINKYSPPQTQMAYKDPEKRKEYLRQWRIKNKESIKEKQREWWEKKCSQEQRKSYHGRSQHYRNQKIDRLKKELGGKCVGCGTTHNLQFDHVDRTQKSFTISANRDKLYELLLEEAKKCQLLCKECHKIKTRTNYDNESLLKGYNLKSIVNTGSEIIITYQISNETQ